MAEQTKAKFLFAEAQARGVTTMWLKDLGYRAEWRGVSPDSMVPALGWELIAPEFSEPLLKSATEALGEIMALARVVEAENGSHRLEVPADAALWIAKVAQDYARAMAQDAAELTAEMVRADEAGGLDRRDVFDPQAVLEAAHRTVNALSDEQKRKGLRG